MPLALFNMPQDNQQVLTNIEGQLLIAMPGLEDPLFNGSLVFVLEHSREGAVGIIINKRLELSIDEVLQQIKTDYKEHKFPQSVLQGGPVSIERGFVLHTKGNKAWEHQVQLGDELFLTTSNDILEALANGVDIGPFQLALGYSGWSEGQLEEELVNNSWLHVNADNQLLFDTPYDERLHAAASKLGIDYKLLSRSGGSA